MQIIFPFFLLIFFTPLVFSLQNRIDASSTLQSFSPQALTTSQRRKLQDGRDCAQAFVQEGVTYTDCTSTKSPDGRMTGQEWCYVDSAQEKGDFPSWGYCVPLLNYDKVREKARDLVYEIMPEIRKVADIVTNDFIPCSDTIDKIEKVEVKQGENDLKSTILNRNIQEIEQRFQLLLGLKAKCERIIEENQLIKKEIEQIKSTAISENSNKNCEGLLGYDDEREGDGIMTEYFDNEAFLGTSSKVIERNINFNWLGRPPLPSINPENFSFKMNGFLKVPVDGHYKFMAVTTDDFSLALNDQSLIDDKKKSQQTNQALSDSLYLIGGLKYQVKFSGSHSSHKNFVENNDAYAKLLWQSEEFPLIPISEQYFYLGNKKPSLKIFNYKSTHFVLRAMREFDDAFKNSRFFKMADIPLQYRNLKQLRSDLHFIENEIHLETNSAVTVFIAVNARLPSPLPADFQNTEETMSLLKLPKNFRTPEKEIRASLSIPFKIYKKNFPEGMIKIPFSISKVRKSRLSFLFFYQVDASVSKNFICGGKEIDIGLYNGPSFDTCKSSSSYPNSQWNCEYAFSGRLIDGPFTMWASNGEGIGAWLEVFFKEEYQVTGIELKNRDNPGERAKEIEVKYSNNEAIVFSLKNTDRAISLPVKPSVTKSIRFTIRSVYGTINNGFALKIVGLPCKLEHEEAALQTETAINLRCEHNLINHEQLMKLSFQIGDRFKASCSSSCIDQNVNIYGSMIYSEDSSICKAAYHMGVIPASGGLFAVLIGPSQPHYAPETKNGITSDMKISSPRSITFESLPNEKAKEISSVFLGMKVDIFDQQLSQWLPAMVIRIDRQEQRNCKVLVSKEGYSSEFNENIDWPDPGKIDFCGEHLPLRFCDQKSQSPRKQNDFTLKICFTAKRECPAGYLPDFGEAFQEKGKMSYGWSGDMTSMARTRFTHYDSLLDNLLLFPPDKASKWCLMDKPTTICEPMYWMIKVPNGKYSIKITVGDPINKSGYWVKVNGKVFVDGKILEKNQFYSPTFDVDVGDEIIKVTSDCDRNCHYIWTRINAIEIKSIPSNFYVHLFF